MHNNNKAAAQAASGFVRVNNRLALAVMAASSLI